MIMQQEDKNAVLLLQGRENCTILVAFAVQAKFGFSALPCFDRIWHRPYFFQNWTKKKYKKPTQNFMYCLAEEECFKVIFLAVYQSLLKV